MKSIPDKPSQSNSDLADTPLLAALVTGSYLATFHVTNNVTMLPVSSIIAVFAAIVIPLVLAVYLLSRTLNALLLARYLPALSIALCTFYLLAGLRTPVLETGIFQSNLNLLGQSAPMLAKLTYPLLSVLAAAAIAWIVRKHLRIYTIALAVMTIAAILPTAWVLMEDSGISDVDSRHRKNPLQNVSLANTPNIYFILADSYGSFAHLEDLGLKVDGFRNWLSGHHFQVYEDAYSNYQPTTAAMPAMFEMQHHYYESTTKFSEISRSGRIVAGGKNALTDFLRQNGYSIEYIHQGDYLLLHGCFADYCFPDTPLAGAKTVLTLVLPGFLRSETPWSTQSTDSVTARAIALIDESPSPRFQYVHLYRPGHANNDKVGICNEAQERRNYAQSVRQTNEDLKELIKGITTRDPDALIIIAGDHGPMIANSCARDFDINTAYEYRDRAGVLLAIRWPVDDSSQPPYLINTTVNLFKYLMASIAENEQSVLATLVPDDVYVRGSDNRILKVLENGEIIEPARAVESRLMRNVSVQ